MLPEADSKEPSCSKESGCQERPDQIKGGGKTAVQEKQKKINETKNTGNRT